MELINALGFDWVIFVSQLINFAILYWLLKKFALDKLMKLLEKRQQDIDMGLKNAQLADQALNQAKAQQEELLNGARKQARTIINEAKQVGKSQEEKIVAEAQMRATKIVENGEKQITLEKNKMLLEVKGELANIIALGVKTVVEQDVRPEKIKQSYLQAGLKA